MPRNKYPEETIKKILDVSLKLFLEKGFEQTTVLDIVDHLGGLTRGAFYHHFKSKEEVLEAIFSQDLSENHPLLKAKNAEVANGLERVRLAMKYGLLLNIENEQHKAITNLAISLLSNPRFLAEQLKSNHEMAELLAPMIEEGRTDGSIKPGNPNVIAELIMLLFNFWMLPNIFPGEPDVLFTRGEVTHQIFEALGCPVIDEEMEEIFVRTMNTLTW
ncbi:MAG: TetR/AcrR family transcriptional regulator [Acidobacteriota bacterium]|nr:TetR/AcrR family transcriptional regulator [Acidobacteriota bacterium]